MICTIVFPIREDRLYLAPKKHKVGAGFLNGWGGKMEPVDGGDITQTALREFNQESTASALKEDLEKVAVINFFRGGELKFECHIFFLHHWTGKMRETSEMGAPVSFPLSDMGPVIEEKMMPGDREWFKKVLSGEKILGNCYYSEDMKVCEKFEYEPL